MRRHRLAVAVAVLSLLAACGDDGAEEDAGPPALPADASPAALRGEALAVEHRCTTCHDGDSRAAEGPSWVGLAGSERTLTDGRAVVADTEYLVRAIVDPRADVVEGYPAIMGSFAFLEDDEVSDLVAYIEALTDE